MPELVYLDYAATSAVRPPEVVDAVAEYLSGVGATPGRSGHRLAAEAGRIALRCRRALAELFGIDGDPGRITLQPNATVALNVAIAGSVSPGDAVVRTAYDHNAVRRALEALTPRVDVRVLGGDGHGGIDLDEAERLLAGDGHAARLLVLPHASNVLGVELPVARLAERAHAVGARVLVDAAQSAGHIPFDVDDLGVDLLAFSGHKGLLGPQGTGGLWVREGVDVVPLLYGGTGGDSAPPSMPGVYPDRLEPGTLNGPGIAGLLAGVRWVLDHDPPAYHARELALRDRLRGRLATTPGVRIRSPAAERGVGIVTLTVDGVSPDEVAHRLDRDFGVLTRAGLHCAPESHELLGTAETGAVRLSIGWGTTHAHIDHAADAVQRICRDATNGK